MRRQCHLVEINKGQIKHKDGHAVPVRLYTHINKTDDMRNRQARWNKAKAEGVR